MWGVDPDLVCVAGVVAGVQARLHFGNTPWVPSQPTACRPSTCPGVRAVGGSPAQRRARASANSGSTGRSVRTSWRIRAMAPIGGSLSPGGFVRACPAEFGAARNSRATIAPHSPPAPDAPVSVLTLSGPHSLGSAGGAARAVPVDWLRGQEPCPPAARGHPSTPRPPRILSAPPPRRARCRGRAALGRATSVRPDRTLPEALDPAAGAL